MEEPCRGAPREGVPEIGRVVPLDRPRSLSGQEVRVRRAAQLGGSMATEHRTHAPTQSRVCVIGTGYVGLTAGACLAHLGHTVVCTDVSEQRVDALRHGHRSWSSGGCPSWWHVSSSWDVSPSPPTTPPPARTPISSSCVCPRLRRTTGARISAACWRWPGRSGRTSGPVPSSLTSPRSPSAPRDSSPAPRTVPTSVWRPTRSSSQRAPRSATSWRPTGWSSAATIRAPPSASPSSTAAWTPT